MVVTPRKVRRRLAPAELLRDSVISNSEMRLKPDAEPSLSGDRTDGLKRVRHRPRSGRPDHAIIAHRSGEPSRCRPRRGSGGEGLTAAVATGVWYVVSSRVPRKTRTSAGAVQRRRCRCAHGATAQPARRGCTANRRDARGNLRILAGARPVSCRVRPAAGRCVRPRVHRARPADGRGAPVCWSSPGGRVEGAKQPLARVVEGARGLVVAAGRGGGVELVEGGRFSNRDLHRADRLRCRPATPGTGRRVPAGCTGGRWRCGPGARSGRRRRDARRARRGRAWPGRTTCHAARRSRPAARRRRGCSDGRTAGSGRRAGR